MSWNKSLAMELLSGAAVSCLLISNAVAQPVDTGGRFDAGAGDSVRQVENVTVTAQGRTENLQSVPIAISVIDQHDVEGLGAKTLSDLARTVPGLNMQAGGLGVDAPVIRGVVAGPGVSTVGIYIDDVPVQFQPGVFEASAVPELYDLSGIEVLRGPQGTLYGGGAMGGAIRFLTPKAPLDEASGRVTAEASGGGYSPNFNVGAAYGAPLVNGELGFRISGYLRESGGYIDRVDRTTGIVQAPNVNDALTGQVHASVLWQPTSALSITASFLYQANSHHDLPVFWSNLPRLQQENVSPQPGHDNFILPSLTVAYDFGFATLKAIGSYYDRKEDQVFDYSTLVPSILTQKAIYPGFTNYLSLADRREKNRYLTQEVRLVSQGNDRLQWAVGFYHTNQYSSFNFPLYEPQFPALQQAVFGSELLGPNLPGNLDSFVYGSKRISETAGYVQATYELVDGLKLTAGARYSKVGLDGAGHTDGPLQGGPGNQEGHERSWPLTPKAALSYNFNPDQMVYVSAAKGFRVGGTNNPVPATTCAADLAAANGGYQPKTTYGPDGVWSYELGYKGLISSLNMTVNAAAYQIDWTNIQQFVALPNCGFGFVTNLGDAKVQGAELETSIFPVDGLKLTGSGSYTDARLSSNIVTTNASGAKATYSMYGDRIPFIPMWNVAVSGQYSWELKQVGTLYLRGDFQYVGSSERTPPPGRIGYDASTYRAQAYGYGSARIGAVWNGWDVSLFVNNIADSRPIIGSYDGITPGTNIDFDSTLPPRTVGITAEHAF